LAEKLLVGALALAMVEALALELEQSLAVALAPELVQMKAYSLEKEC
jgi:hypothetical protein